MFAACLKFALVGGLFGETMEVLRLEAGGMGPADSRLRLTLFCVYAVFSSAFFLASAVVWRRKKMRAVAFAVTGLGVLVTVPWLNFDYLPGLATVRTAGVSLLAVAIVAGLAPVVVRFRRVLAAGIVLLALGANGRGMLRSSVDGRVAAPAGRQVRRGANLLLVVIDTLRADHLGTYGYDRPTSPEIDRFARGSVVFDRAVAQAPWTKPSIASLLTSRYSHRHGVVGPRDALGDGQKTLAEVLHDHGYRTAAFSANPWITPQFGFDQGFDSFESFRALGLQLTNVYRLVRRGERALRYAGLDVDLADTLLQSRSNLSNARRDEELSDLAVEWLTEKVRQPFFAYVHLMGPHNPYNPPEEYVKKFRNPEWEGGRPRLNPPARVQSVFQKAKPLDRADLANLIGHYDAAVAHADALLGRLLGALDRVGLTDRTLVVVAADHGEEFHEHENWRHGNQLYDEVVHVPLLFRWPGRLTPQRRKAPVMLIDVFPTVLHLLEIARPSDNIDGHDLFGGGMNRPAFSEHRRVEGAEYVSRMVLRGRTKLIETRDDLLGRERTEVFDLLQDRGENVNLIGMGSPEAEKITVLRELLKNFGRGAKTIRAPAVDIDRATQERLHALGY